jgi:hypothetical protein
VVSDLLNSPLLRIGFYLVDVFFMMLWLSVVYWTFIDADRRGTPRFFWASVALIFPFIGTLIYVIVHPPEYLLDSRERELDLAVLEREFRRRVDLCPNRRSVVEKEYLLCRECGWDLKSPARTAGGSGAWTGNLPVLRDRAEQKEHQLVGG